MAWSSPPAGWATEDGLFVAPAGVVPDQTYPEHVRDALAAAEDRHFWFRSRSRLIADVVEAQVGPGGWLEIGCGTGHVLAEVARRYAGRSAGQDISRHALEVARRRSGAELYLSRPEDIPLRDLAGVGLFDVIEHLDDDVGALRLAASHLRPGGSVVVTVPAHAWLWSQVDEASGHRRRYGRRELMARLASAGLDVQLCRPFFACLLPGMVARRMVRVKNRDAALSMFLSTPPSLVNRVFGVVTEAERRLFGLGASPLGTSWLAVARR